MKRLVLARARDDRARAAFRDWLRTDFDAAAGPAIGAAQAAAVMIADAASPFPDAGDEAGHPLYDAVIEIWSDAAIALPVLAARADLIAVAVEARIGAGTGDADATAAPGRTPGTALLSFCSALPGAPRAETLRHWREHVPLACEIHHGMTRYVQNVILAGPTPAMPWFGMAHLQFPSFNRVPQDLFRSAADVATIEADVADFIATSPVMFATRHVLKAAPAI